MLDPKLLRNHLDDVVLQLKKRRFAFDVDGYKSLDEKRKHLQTRMQTLQNERNVRSKAVGHAKSKGDDQLLDQNLSELKQLSEELTLAEQDFASVQKALDDFLLLLPNIPHESVPEGVSEEQNEVVRVVMEPRKFSFKPKDHVELGLSADRMDFEAASKLSGARFVVLRKEYARLYRALGQFMLDVQVDEHGYQEVYVPSIVNAECLMGTGQLPKFREDLFGVNGEEQFLIPTSEVPLTNTVRDSIVDEKQLPIQMTAFSSCFRSEAGSYGKDMRGMIRLHQFEKVELVHISHPDRSFEQLEIMLNHAETILKKLELPYRVVNLCGGDLGFGARKTYDIEVWLPSQDRYREISSCSNTGDFQARRMKARYRSLDGRVDYVHTLNGSGLAVGRTLVAVVENFQDELGRVHVPEVLWRYMGGCKVIE